MGNGRSLQTPKRHLLEGNHVCENLELGSEATHAKCKSKSDLCLLWLNVGVVA